MLRAIDAREIAHRRCNRALANVPRGSFMGYWRRQSKLRTIRRRRPVVKKWARRFPLAHRAACGVQGFADAGHPHHAAGMLSVSAAARR